MISYIEKFVMHPYPIRTAYIKLVKKLHLFNYEHRIRIGAVERPHYGYCLYQGCILAKKLGLSRMSVVEFGVAGGSGLVTSNRSTFHWKVPPGANRLRGG